MIRPALVIVAAAYAGAALSVWWLSGFVPWFLLPDIPFLGIVFAALLLEGPAGLGAAAVCAFVREICSSMPPWTLFLSSLALYFFTREITRRIYFRAESFILATVAALMIAESLSVTGLLAFSGGRSPTLLWGLQEAVRIAWTSLLSVPLFMDLSVRWRRVTE